MQVVLFIIVISYLRFILNFRGDLLSQDLIPRCVPEWSLLGSCAQAGIAGRNKKRIEI